MTSADGLVALSDTAPLWIPALTRLAAYVGATRTGRRIDASLKTRLRWLSDPEARKAFFEAFSAGTTRYEDEQVDSLGARAITRVLVHIAEHGDEGIDRVTILEQIFRNQTDRQALEDIVHRYAWVLESKIVPLEEVSQSLRELIDDYLRPAFLQSPYFTAQVGFAEVIGLLRDIRDQLSEPVVDLAVLEEDYRSQLTDKHEYITMQGISPRVQNRTIGIKMKDVFIPVRAVRHLDPSPKGAMSLEELSWELYGSLRNSIDGRMQNEDPAEPSTTVTASTPHPLLTEFLPASSTAPEIVSSHYPAVTFYEHKPWPHEEAIADIKRYLNEALAAKSFGPELTLSQLYQQLREEMSTEPSDLLDTGRVVLQGHPGSGKSTLTRYVTWAAASRSSDVIGASTAERTPVLIRAINFGEALEASSVTTLEEYLTDSTGRFAPVIKHALLTGRAIVLIDGLDEVGKLDLRSRVAECVDDFLADPLFDNNSVVVTTRIVGYERTGLLGRLPHYTLSDLTDEQISTFVQAWYQAINAELPDAVDVTAERERLLEAIDRKPSIQRMARNPLLLTIIALIKWQGRALPDLRVLLYDVAAQTLIRSWPLTQRRVELDELLIREWLAPLAFRIFSDPGTDLIDEFSLMGELVDSMQRLKPMTELEARRASQELLENVSLHTGVLLPQGTDKDGRTLYGFLHQTFTEYFTAYLLTGKWEDGDLNLAQYAHNPYWQEVILLMAGHLGIQRREKAGRFLRDLRQLGSSPFEAHIHRDLLLALRILADGVPVGPGEFVEELLHDTLKVWRTTPFQVLRTSISDSLGGLSATEYGVAFLRLARRMPLRDSEYLALAEQLGAESFVQELRNILAKGSDPDKDSRSAATLQRSHSRLRAAALLAKVGDVQARDVLYSFTQGSPSAFYAVNAIKELIGLGDPRGTDAVVRILTESAVGPMLPGLEFMELGAVVEDPRVRAALKKLLRSSRAAARERAATVLLHTQRLSTVELAAVLRAEPLASGRVSSPTLRGLDAELGDQLSVLLRHRDAVIRLQAARGLMLQKSPNVNALLPLLDDPDSRVQLEVAGWFLEVGEPRALDALASLLDEDTDLRLEAARMLHRKGDVRGTNCLRSLLQVQQPEIRMQAAVILADKDNPAVVQILVAALDDPDPDMRVPAAGAMASWGDRRAIEPVLELLTKALSNRSLASRRLEFVLTQLEDSYVTDRLLEILTAAERASGMLVRILARRKDPRATQKLKELLVDEDIEVRTDAALALLSRTDEETRIIVEGKLGRILEDIQDQKGPRKGALADATYDFIQKHMSPTS